MIEFLFNSKGKGVGDNDQSFGFDGERSHAWGGVQRRKKYGKKWENGDVIGILLSFIIS